MPRLCCHGEKRFPFSKKDRLTCPEEFKAAMKFGKKVSSRNFVLFKGKNKGQGNRLGIVVSKEVGNAAYRNRIKRLCREFFRLHQQELGGGFDLVIRARSRCAVKRYAEVEGELKRLIFL